jgi:hypothetical protein
MQRLPHLVAAGDLLDPDRAADDRGFSTHGGGTRAAQALTSSSVNTGENGTGMPRLFAFTRIASLSRNRLAVVRPMPGSCRCSRSIAPISTSKSSSAAMRSMRWRVAIPSTVRLIRRSSASRGML